MNDVTVLGGGGIKGDNSTEDLVLKSVTMGGGGVKNYRKLRDVIYGRPLRETTNIDYRTWLGFYAWNRKNKIK